MTLAQGLSAQMRPIGCGTMWLEERESTSGSEKGCFNFSMWRAQHGEEGEKGQGGGRGMLEKCNKVTEG